MGKKESALWDKFSVIYDSFMKGDMPAYRQIIDRISNCIDGSSKVLEVATGTGIIALGLADSGAQIHAVDFAPNMIVKASEKALNQGVKNINFSVQDAYNLGFESECFDVVVIANTLHVMEHPQNAVREIKRVLKKDGIIISPTFLHAQTAKSKVISRFMSFTGFKAYYKWNYESFKLFIESCNLSVEEGMLIESSLPIGYVEAKRREVKNDDSFDINLGLYHDLVASIMAALDAKDHFTADHSMRVSDMTEAICRLMRMDKETTETIHMAAHVHDIGKIGVPDAVLLKPGALNEDEFELIKQHPRIGANILRKSKELSKIAEIVLHHHERWDGKGYPGGFERERIPLGSRIIAVSDSIDAMITNRPYRRALSVEECRLEIEKNSGKMYDPDVVRVVLENWKDILTVAKQYEKMRAGNE